MEGNQVSDLQKLSNEMANSKLQDCAGVDECSKSEAATEICSLMDGGFTPSCSCGPSEMTGGGSCCAAIVEKLMDQLKASEAKCAKLEKNEQALTGRAEQAEAALKSTDWEIKSLESTISTQEREISQLQQLLWKFFASPHQLYYIKFKQYRYRLNACCDGTLKFCDPDSSTSRFKLIKNSDGTFAIFSPALGKYLAWLDGYIGFYADKCDKMTAKFDFIFENESATKESERDKVFGFSASIRVLANDTYIYFRKSDNFCKTSQVALTPHFSEAKYNFSIFPC